MKLTALHILATFFLSALVHGAAGMLISFAGEKTVAPKRGLIISIAQVESYKEAPAVAKKRKVRSLVINNPAPKHKASTPPVKKPGKPHRPMQARQMPQPLTKINSPNLHSDIVPEEVKASYEQVILAWLAKHKHYPRSALRRGIEGEVTLFLQLGSSGKVVKSYIQASSSSPLLDREVLSMVERAEPFPEIPQQIQRRELQFIIPVMFQLS